MVPATSGGGAHALGIQAIRDHAEGEPSPPQPSDLIEHVLGEATYAQMIHPGEEIIAGKAERFRVLDVVTFEEEDEPPFVGLLQVESAIN